MTRHRPWVLCSQILIHIFTSSPSFFYSFNSIQFSLVLITHCKNIFADQEIYCGNRAFCWFYLLQLWKLILLLLMGFIVGYGEGIRLGRGLERIWWQNKSNSLQNLVISSFLRQNQCQPQNCLVNIFLILQNSKIHSTKVVNQYLTCEKSQRISLCSFQYFIACMIYVN